MTIRITRRLYRIKLQLWVDEDRLPNADLTLRGEDAANWLRAQKRALIESIRAMTDDQLEDAIGGSDLIRISTEDAEKLRQMQGYS